MKHPGVLTGYGSGDFPVFRPRVAKPLRLSGLLVPGVLALGVLLVVTTATVQADEPADASTAPAATTSQDAPAPPADADADAPRPATTTPPVKSLDAAQAVNPATLPFVRINREKHWIDFDAKVVLREGQWVELLVCTPGTREYESILSTEARPSHLHLALLILNQAPGQPLGWKREGGQVVSIPPSGPTVEVFIRYLQNGQTVEVPAGQWVMDQKANRTLEGATWLFAGSKFMAVEGRPVYLADVNGSCISLVNFGDDLLTRPTETTHHNDNAQFAANTAVIPQVGTAVVVRLKVKPKAAGDAPAGNGQGSTETSAEKAAVESETTGQP